MKKILTTFFLIAFFVSIAAQPGRNSDDQSMFQFGFKAGSVYTSISDLSKVLVSESYYTDYTFENISEWGFTGGLFMRYKFDQSISAIYSEITYSRLGNRLHYSDINDFEYDFILKYNYVNLDFWYRAYVFSGLHLGVGTRLGFNITPGGLYYTSNGEDLFGPDIRIQQQMRDVLKGRNNFCIGISTGYDFHFGLSIDARFYYGLSDVMETEVNNFNFIENNNSSLTYQVTVGYAIPYDLKFF